MNTATFNRRFKQLEYFTSRNTSTFAHCTNLASAKAIIRRSGVVQSLLVLPTGYVIDSAELT